MIRRAARPLAKGIWRLAAAATPSLRALPDFLVIGAQKAGTTSLMNYLGRHPLITRPTRGEVHFFDREYDRGERWYRSHFATNAYRRAIKRLRGSLPLIGEATPAYLPHPAAPQRAAALLPDARLIALLREPVARAHSHYHHQVRKGRETRGFAEAIESELEQLASAGARASSSDEESNGVLWRHSYLERGKYVDQLIDWERHFPRERFHIVCSEVFYSSPETEMGYVTDHLGLPRGNYTNLRRYNYHGDYEKIDPTIESRMREFYEPFNTRLAAHLGRSFPWA